MRGTGQGGITLRSLVGHRESVQAAAPLEDVHRRFAETGRDFLAVLDGDRLLGVCARRDIAMRLGARFGFALYARRPVSENLLPAALSIADATPIHAALSSVSARTDSVFYDDVLLVDENGGFLGFIFVHALVRLQTELMLGNIRALESSRQEIAEKNRSMEEDLLMAREVQLAMLPPSAEDTPSRRWRFQAHYEPAGGVSGDFYQLIRISDTEAGVLVCDVMGHGVRSAFITAMLRAFAEDLLAQARDPGALLTRLNQGLMGVLRQAGNLLFVTAAYVVVDTRESTLRYGQAGHPTGFIVRAAGSVELLPVNDEVAGPALGLMEESVYASASARFGPGDAAIMYTDGVSEARNASGEEWGPDRLRDELGRQASVADERRLVAAVDAARRFAGRAFDDDICLVSLAAKP